MIKTEEGNLNKNQMGNPYMTSILQKHGKWIRF